MRLLHRASPWRTLFADGAVPDRERLSTLLAPLCEAVDRLGPSPSLAELHAWQRELVDVLSRLELPAWRISQLISDHNDALYRRAIEASLAEMRGQGWGEPPVAFCVLTLGSAARHESLLAPDQDNAMIIANYPDARHGEIDGFFQALGERFTERLDAAGIPLCRGHVMARWPMWRKRLVEWQRQLEIWTAERRVKRAQQASILLDVAPVYGNADLAEALRAHVSALLPRAGLFVDELAALLEETPAAAERFGRLVAARRDDRPHRRALDLKHQGLLPLVNAVRLLAWCHGVQSVETRSRLVELVASGALRADRAEALQRAHGRMQALLLDAQRADLGMGRAAGDWIDLATLDEAGYWLLRHDMRLVRRLGDFAASAARQGRR
ncbi:DUF294 nucleotidyltransferase-like domain-containing protein [Halomonas organivorans]|uniref:CBS domain-containing protein n=1 Tax=Halomonas organivorans TaxID=257772 RepID=A0A7W5G6D6_9GAMM|nr:DUF294 nucleotidyltransferase-like domain-containing protein [Halomonas organivorans]MBB3142084.1 CBS domain-containing protein [Halomonas organivorans]